MNLTQAIALKCLTDISLPSTSSTISSTTTTATNTTESVAGVLDAYFDGSRLYKASDAQSDVFPYAFNKVTAVKDIFALCFLLKQLRSAILRAQKSLPATATPWEVVRVQLLLNNVDYASGNMKTLCNKLHLLLQQASVSKTTMLRFSLILIVARGITNIIDRFLCLLILQYAHHGVTTPPQKRLS